MNPGQLRQNHDGPEDPVHAQGDAAGPHEDRQPVKDFVERLMGRDPAQPFEFIQQRASSVEGEAIDV
jgi:topoisomerase IV subunit B